MNDRRDRLHKMVQGAAVTPDRGAVKPGGKGQADPRDRTPALLFAPPPTPTKPYVTLLEEEGFDVLIAQNPPTAEALLRTATPGLILAIAPAIGHEILERWKEMAPEAEIRVIPAFGELVNERLAPPKDIMNFTMKVLSVVSGMVQETSDAPSTRIPQVLAVAGKAATALEFSARDVVTVQLSAVLSGLASTLQSDTSSDQDTTAIIKKTPLERRKLVAEFAQAVDCPFPVGLEPPSTPASDRPPTPEEVLDAVIELVDQLENNESNPALTLRRLSLEGEDSATKLHPAAVEAVLAASGKEDGQERPTILLADGDAAARNLLALRLRNEGYAVRLAGDGRKALEEIQKQPPALVLAETVLNGLDGYTLLDRAKREGKGNIPFIFLSSRSDPLSINKGLLLGASDFLTKPVNFEVLLTKLEKVLVQSVGASEASARLSLSDVSQPTSSEYPSVRYEELQPGTVILGRFQLEPDLGEGGMGKVFKATDQQLEEQVVIKVMNPNFADDVFRRFKREIRLARKITHPGVVRIFDFWEAGTLKFVTMEFLEGTELNDQIKTRGAFPVPVVVRIATEMMEALAAAHEVGVIHRDIKPQNIVLTSSGKVKVLDFGIAQGLEPEAKDAVTIAGAILGTPEYMSPEQLMGEKLDPRSDLYSTGVMLYQLLTATLPFVAEDRMAGARMRLVADPKPPSTLDSKIPKALDAFILRLLQRRPDDRYPSAGTALSDLAALRQSQP